MKRETREKWERANEIADCDRNPGTNVNCPLWNEDDWYVDSPMHAHDVAASAALDGCDIRELP